MFLSIIQNIHILSIVAPLAFGLVSFAIKDKFKKLTNVVYLSFYLSLFITIFASFFYLNLFDGKNYTIVIGGWSKAIGIELKYNLKAGLAMAFAVAIMVIFFATNLKNDTSGTFRGFACIMSCGAIGIILTNDIFNSYVFFEIICITSYIVYAHCNKIDGLKNVYNYMILSGFAGIVFLITAGLLYQITGHLNIDLIYKKISQFASTKSISTIYVLFVVSMLFKLGVYPLHNTIFSIYKNLQTNYLILVSGISSIAYPYFMIKIITNVFDENVVLNNEYFGFMLKFFGGIGFIFFNAMALYCKSMLNFIIALSLAQTSFLSFCIPSFNNKDVVNGIIFSITSTTVLKGAFLGLLYKVQTSINFLDIGKTDIRRIDNKIYKLLFVVLLFLLAGMPFSLVFMSKWYSIVGLFYASNSVFWMVIIIIGYAIDIFACFSFIKKILSNTVNNTLLCVKNDFLIFCSVAFAILLVIAGGLFVGFFR